MGWAPKSLSPTQSTLLSSRSVFPVAYEFIFSKTSHRYLEYKICPKWTHHLPSSPPTKLLLLYYKYFIIFSVTQVETWKLAFLFPHKLSFLSDQFIPSSVSIFSCLISANCINSLLNDHSCRLSTLVCLPNHHYTYLINTNLIMWASALSHGKAQTT